MTLSSWEKDSTLSNDNVGDGYSLPISKKYIPYMKEERNYQTLNEQDCATINAEIERKASKN